MEWLSSLLGWLGRLGAELAMAALALCTIGGAIFIGGRVADRTGKNWIGWAAGIAALLIIVAIFGPTQRVLQQAACTGASDFQSCLDGE